jgi:hypothetical protein
LKGLAAVVLDDDDETRIAIAKAGNKWRKLADIVDTMEWSTMKACDAEGNVLALVRNPESDDVDDEPDEPQDRPLTLADVVTALVAVQRSSMSETRQMFQSQMDGYGRIIEGMAEANRAISDSYALALRVQSAAQATAAAGSAEGGTEVMEMVKMAGQMMLMERMNPKPQPAPQTRVVHAKPARVVAVPPKPAAEGKPDGES